MMALAFFLYLIVAMQVVYKPNVYIPLQLLICLLFTLYSFNFHSHLVHL